MKTILLDSHFKNSKEFKIEFYDEDDDPKGFWSK